MFVLIVSLISLVLGLCIAPHLMRFTRSLSFFEGFVSIFIGGLVLFHIFPHSFSDVGYWALPLLFLGAFIPEFIEKKQGTGVLTLIFLGLGFSIHAFLDGLGLQLHDALLVENASVEHQHTHEHEESSLVWAILAHRIPVGLFLGFAAIQKPKLAYFFCFLICLATVSGFYLGREIPFMGGLQAIIGGTLLHVIIGHRIVDPHIEQNMSIRSMGAITAGLFLFLSSDGHMDTAFLEAWSFASFCLLLYLTVQIPKHECIYCKPQDMPAS